MGQLEDIQVFIRIVNAGGIGRAADQLGIAKSAVSRRLSELEARLGVKLLQRTTRALSLTDIGRHYYTKSVSIIDDIDALNASTTNNNSELSGAIRISVPLSFGLAHLSPLIHRFAEQHSNVDFHIDLSDKHTDLVEEGIDLAIRIGELNDSSLSARKISSTSLILCAAPNYLEQFGHPKTPTELKQHTVLRYSGSNNGNWDLLHIQTQEYVRIKPKASITANNGDFLYKLACEGKGIILSPSFICWQALAKKQLIPIMPNYRAKTFSIYAVYPKTRYLPQRARLFIDYLVDALGEAPYWE